MSSGIKRDAQEAFGGTSLDVAATRQQQKKQKSSRRKSKTERQHRESPKHTNDNHEREQIVGGNVTKPSSSTKGIVKRAPQSSTREGTNLLDGEVSVKHRNSTLSRSEGRKKKEKEPRSSIPVAAPDPMTTHEHKISRHQEAQNRLKNSSGKKIAQPRIAAATSQGAEAPTEHSVSEQQKSSLSESVVKPHVEGSHSDEKEEETDQVKSSRRDKKLQRRQRKPETKPAEPVVREKREEHGKSKKSKRNRDQQQVKRQPRSNSLESPAWILSSAIGGAFIDHDPVLTPDEQTLILATDKDVLIYSTRTSLLVRKLNIGERSTIVSYALVPANTNFLYIGLQNDNIYKYEWTSGRQLWHYKIPSRLKSITPTSSGPDGDNLLIVHSTEKGGRSLSSLSFDANGELTGEGPMISHESLNGSVKFSAETGIAIICSSDTAYVGQFIEKADETGRELQWNQISFPSSMTCFDAQILPPSASTKSKKRARSPTVNIAVGLTSGEIHLYSDILNQGLGLTDNQSSSVTTRRLHWHRTAPLSVKFSPDSNYLVSGGDETVLVIWQLDTNQKQVLPHLTTPILNLTISHQGSAYALRLADNSVMVLSTADLQPFANINGLALPISSEILHQPVVLHPNHTDRLLLAHSLRAVKSERSKNYKSSTMLQTYDIGSQIQIGSQALARNLVSVVNAGPNGKPLQEPNVTHLDVSYDGKWLASVDQWSPNRRDLDEMYLSRGDNPGRKQNHECYLRLWASTSMKEGNTTMNEQWELNTRIDEAVIESEWLSGGSRTLAILFSPVRHQLALADSNRHLKIYSPKARMRSGLPIKDQDGNQLFTWTCDHEMPLDATEDPKIARHAALTFSEDGSVLAACWTSKTSGAPRVHLIDPKIGFEATSVPNLITPNQPMVGFYHQYLICLSGKLCIFDTVNAQTIFEFDLSSGYDQTRAKMAIDVRNGTLAMSVDIMQHSSRLLLFDVRSGLPSLVYDQKVTVRVAALLPDKVSGGFVIIYQDAKIARLSASGQQREILATTDLVESRVLTNGIGNIFGSGQKQIKDMAEPARGNLATDRPQRGTLEDVFRFDTTAQAPSVKELFTQVAQAVAGRSD